MQGFPSATRRCRALSSRALLRKEGDLNSQVSQHESTIRPSLSPVPSAFLSLLESAYIHRPLSFRADSCEFSLLLKTNLLKRLHIDQSTTHPPRPWRKARSDPILQSLPIYNRTVFLSGVLRIGALANRFQLSCSTFGASAAQSPKHGIRSTRPPLAVPLML